ncbi:hypothetical protein EUX98_g7785 [Antrodiella citrinella]|uniref:Uncharacterized protein n=1 Tax=Antrodiella citrinella TaxID=2447956 RepID=A0A4S4ML78_9APHY|nr:hypothetical protein EUX98_g7785 [Antrodiella citrinella]
MLLKFKHILHRVFHSNMATSESDFAYPPQQVKSTTTLVPPANTTIAEYAHHLLELTIFQAARLRLSPSEYHSHHQILNVYHCKSGGSVEHEWVGVQVRDPTNPKKPVYICFDRGVKFGVGPDPLIKDDSKEVKAALGASPAPAGGSYVAEAAATAVADDGVTEDRLVGVAQVDSELAQPKSVLYAHQTGGSSISVSSFNSISSSVNAFIRAHDCARKLPGPPPENEVMLAMDVTSLKLSLLQFTYIAYSINMMDPMYSVLYHQCYWFASILVTLLFESLDILIRKQVLADNKTEVARRALMRNDGDMEYVEIGRAGCFWKVQVVKLREAVIRDATRWSQETWNMAVRKMKEDDERTTKKEADLATKKEADLAEVAKKKEADLAEVAEKKAALAKWEADLMKREADLAAAAKK